MLRWAMELVTVTSWKADFNCYIGYNYIILYIYTDIERERERGREKERIRIYNPVPNQESLIQWPFF